MSVQVRHVAYERGASPILKRASAVLSDGSAVVMVADNNQTGVTGDGGDSTGVPKLYFYHSTDRVIWTLKNTITITKAGAHIVASMCVDTSNNIHMAWRNSSNGLTYKRLVFSAGPTWAADADSIVVATPPTSATYVAVDIDVFGTSTTHVVVAGLATKSVSPLSTEIRAFVRRTDAAWIAQSTVAVITGDYMAYQIVDMSVAADQQAVGGDNIGLYALSAVRFGYTTKKDFGDVIWVVKTNVSTGATAATTVAAGPFNAGQGSGRRKLWLFSSGNDKWVVAGVCSTAPWRSCVVAFTWNRVTNTRASLDINVIRGDHGTIIFYTDTTQWCSAAYNKANQRVIVFGMNGSYLYSATVRLDQTNKTAYPQVGSSRWDNDFRYGGVVPVQGVNSGAQSRNTTSSTADTTAYFWKAGTTAAYRVQAHSTKASLAPSGVEPAALALVTTDRPVLAASHELSQKWGQHLYKGEWQLATDAGFSANPRTVIEGDVDYIAANLTPVPDNALVRTTESIPAISELFQGTWFIRARTLDLFGGVGAWSSSLSFTVAHPPVAANLWPTGSIVIVLSAANLLTVSWDFTDPNPWDSQTAYQVVVEDNETGVGVVDTGKVVSTQDQASVTIPSGDKDKVLRWRVILWDSDDVAGPASVYQLFIVTDPPEPVITSPTPDEILTSGTPFITWDPGLSAIQVQTAYKLTVVQGEIIRHDSGWLFGDETSYPLPLGVLSNGNNYTLTVRVRENFNLEGFATQAFSTAWTPPDAPTGLQIYLSEYAKRGFVYVVQDIDEVEVDVVSYNLYRRKFGESEWVLVKEWQNFSAAHLVYRDYLVGSGETYQYVCTQVVNSFGDILESAITAEQVYNVVPLSDRFWLLDTVDMDTESLPLYSVTANPFTDEYEQETFSIIGRGRHVDYGDRLGYAGVMSCQLRDHVIDGIEHTNYALNPAMQNLEVGSVVPDRWTVVESGGPIDYITGPGESQDPSPTGKLLTPELFVIDMPNAGIIQLQQQIELAELPPAIAGNTVTFSVWCYGLTPMGTNTQWRLDMSVLNAAESVLASVGSHTQTSFETYTSEAFGTPDYLNPSDPVTGIWQRFKVDLVWPSGAPDHVRIAIGARNNTGGVLTNGFRITGAQLEIGAVTPYIDGDQFGASWLGVPNFAASYSNGYYSGRQQRLNLENLKRLRRTAYLRSPFGDIFQAATGNMSVTPIAGTGRTEFTDVEIPYVEVGE